MSLSYLLDTNILSDVIRNPQGGAANRIIQTGNHTICTSIVVACELRFGAEKRASAQLTRRIEALLSALEILPYAMPADSHYARLRCHLERVGTPIGPNDLLIAAHTLSLNLTLVTANTREFSHVPKLKVENWLQS